MTTEMNAEKLREVKYRWGFGVENGIEDPLYRTDIEFLIQQAERAQGLEIENVHLLKAHELKDMEHQGLVQQLKDFQKENARLRETLHSACNSLGADIEDYL